MDGRVNCGRCAMGVDRCVCRSVPFARLIELARERGAGFDELQRRTGCGTGCGMCIPYIRVALATGRADLPVMDVVEGDSTENPANAGTKKGGP